VNGRSTVNIFKVLPKCKDLSVRQPDYPNPDTPKWAAVDSYLSGLLTVSDVSLENVISANANAGMPAHSTIWMAKALPVNGTIVTIENNPIYAEVAQHNIHLAGVAPKVDFRVGNATEILPTLQGHFDLIFIDADKHNNPTYLEWAMKLARAGTVIIADNIVRGGSVVDANNSDSSVQGVRRYLEMVAMDARLDSTALQTVGEKGWDGFSISIVQD
jgi:predicted O-methyltransferase YrrM